MISTSQIYHGIRGNEFKNLIKNILEKGNLKDKYISFLLNDENLQKYDQAFTAISANKEKNYEFYEQMGDLTINNFIVKYSYKRFPQLKCTEGVKVVARLRINYGSRQSFSDIADKLNIWDYISADEEERSRKKKDLLEDCLESFIGCTEYILDEKYCQGVGYGIVYNILSKIFDNIHMSIDYDDLYDSKTRLKELFDSYSILGKIEYIDSRTETLAISTIYRVPCGISNLPLKNNGINIPRKEWECLGYGHASKKSDAQQKAAQESLKILNKNGYVKEIPIEYLNFKKL